MKKKKILAINYLIFFILLGIAVFAKMLFFGLAPDEEYQIVMSYRLARGDGLFFKSWDTIQTSGFLNYFLIKAYLLTGTVNGIVLFLRFFGMMFQLGCAFAVYRRIKRILKPAVAFVIAAFAYFAFTKIIAAPDFSNMLLWFLALMLCFLWDAYDWYRLKGELSCRKIILAALMLSAAVLSQACFLLVPVTVFLLCSLFPKHKRKANLLFFGTCAVTAVLYLAGILLSNGVTNTMNGIRGILTGDLTHSSGANILGQSKIITYARNGISVLLWLAATALAAFLISFVLTKLRKKGNLAALTALVWNLLAALVTLYNWLWKSTGYDGLKLYIPCLLCTSFFYWCKCRKKLHPSCPIPFYGVLLGIGVFLNVLFISNVPMINNLSFLIPAVLWGMVLLAQCFEEQNTYLTAVFVCTSLLAAAGTLFTLQSSPAGCTIFDCDGRIADGPAKGILIASSTAEVYSSESQSFLETVPDNSTVLLVTNCYKNTLLYYCYLQNNVNISHYSVNSTPTYTKTLEGYWVMYPDKYPEVIVVNDSTYYYEEYGWIFDYIEHYYGYTRKVKTEYATYYFK